MSDTILVVHAGSEEYGIPVAAVQSIETSEIEMVENLPEYMRGTIHVRGELIPVFDLECILYGDIMEISSESRIIILKAADFTYGLLVKMTKEILEIAPEVLRQIELIKEQTKYISAFASMEDGIIAILDPVNLFEMLKDMEKIKDFLQSQEETV